MIPGSGRSTWRRDRQPTPVFLGFPCGSASKESACSVGDLGSIPGLGRSPGEGNSYPLQYSGLENSMDYTVHGVAKSQIQLSDFHLYPYAAAAKLLQLCPTLRAHRRQPTRLLRPWDSPGKNTGVGCHFLLQCIKAKSERKVAHSCLTLSDPMDCSLPDSSVHGIFQARVLEWGATAFSTYGI